MSMDRSLKTKAGLSRHRNVLSRAERLAVLTAAERWSDSKSVFGLPKVSHRKSTLGTKKKEKKAVEGEEGAAAAAAPGAAAPAVGAKGAAPAAGAKPGAKAGAVPAKDAKGAKK